MSKFTDGMSILCQTAAHKEPRPAAVDVAWWASSQLHRFWDLYVENIPQSNKGGFVGKSAMLCRCRAIIAHDRVMNLVENGERR